MSTASTIPMPIRLSLTASILPRGARSLSYRILQINRINAAYTSRVSYFTPTYSYSSHLPLSLCNRSLLPRSPLHLLHRLCSRSLVHFLSVMASSDSKISSSTKTERVVIKGKVQGVWYRNWTIDNATQMGLKGWVRNRKDGSVEALFSGTPEAVQEMEQKCRRGPPDAVVTGLEVFPSSDDPGYGFERKPTL